MLQSLKIILEIQKLDIKMLRLLRLKKDRQKELHQIDSLRQDLKKQLEGKQLEIAELTKNIAFQELKIQEIEETIKKLEAKQVSVKKVDEFNALTRETTQAEREKIATEHIASDLIDKRTLEEEILEKIKESLKDSEESSKTLEEEIKASIRLINVDGLGLKKKRDDLVTQADPEILKIYERLLRNKRDQVVVPIEKRTCSGCHIVLTAQHENVVRKGKRLVFCEHCSRIHFWQESEELQDTTVATKKRRRRLTNV